MCILTGIVILAAILSILGSRTKKALVVGEMVLEEGEDQIREMAKKQAQDELIKNFKGSNSWKTFFQVPKTLVKKLPEVSTHNSKPVER